MPTAEFRRPARFRLKDTDAFLARHPDGKLWSAIPAGFGGPETIFEHGDPEAERAAANQGYLGHWIDESEAQDIEARQRRITAAKPGEYPWDDWRCQALAAGVSDELANLGRAVMREADQHNWCDSLKYECGAGHEDSANGMILEAKECPDSCRVRWQWLLATDGLRFDPWDQGEMSPRDLHWNELHQRWTAENHPVDDERSNAAFQRTARREIKEAHQLDQLAIITLSNQAFHRSDEVIVFYAEYAVIETERGDRLHPHIPHQGLVQVRFDSKLSEHPDAGVFGQRES